VVFLPAAGEASFAAIVSEREDTLELLENQGEMLGKGGVWAILG